MSYYLMRGKNPEEWCESSPIGPFPSVEKAEAGIKADVKESVAVCDSLSPGRTNTWADKYTIVQFVKTVQPCLDVTVKVTLKKETNENSTII